MQLAGVAEVNKHYLKLVDTALFVLCLDHTSPSTAAEVSYLVLLLTSLLKQWLSECGRSVESLRLRNVYNDGSVQLVRTSYIHRVASDFCLPFPSH